MCPLVLALLLALAVVSDAAAADPTLRITTDTAEYCGSLAARLAAMREHVPPAAQALAADGMRLCGNGHVRTGVAKLRRAIRLSSQTQ